MKRSRARRAVCLLTALAMTLGLWYGMPAMGNRAGAITQADIDAMKGELDGINDEIAAVEAQLAQIANDKAQALEQVRLLDEQIFLLNQQIARTDEAIAQYDELIAIKETEIADIEAREAAQYELFCKQVRSMEEQGSVSYFSILFDAADFSDLLDRAMMISEIMDYNNSIIEMLLATREELSAAKAGLEASRAEQQALREEQSAAKAELEVRQADAAALVQRILDQEAGYEAAVAALEEENARMEEEIKNAEEELAAQLANVVSEAGFYWPVPGFYILTSGFGWRTHPVYGNRRHHNGTDIAGAGMYGTPIYAAKSGVVSTSVRISSYGNYVVITHSDGYQTLYAHMSRRAVSKGDVVEQGQIIGYVGDTGVVTGTHLHYEVWYNGERTDAELYYPNLESLFIRRYNGE